MLASKILEIVDKNGFDWWGNKTPNCGIGHIWGEQGINIEDSNERERVKSLSDLATNKSFLNALGKIKFENDGEKLETGTHIEACTIVYHNGRDLQKLLIENLTQDMFGKGGDGKDFWKICAEFIGIKE